jgi:hypothetical protein
MNDIISILKVVFPALMVAGAIGSFILNMKINAANWPVSLQWIGAAALYTALLFRNQ